MKPLALLAVSTLLLVSACGTSRSDRTLSGAAIGGAAGAATGAFTSPDTIYLGKPVWR